MFEEDEQQPSVCVKYNFLTRLVGLSRNVSCGPGLLLRILSFTLNSFFHNLFYSIIYNGNILLKL